MHRLLRCNINTSVHAHARSGRVTQRCHNSPDRKRGLQSAGDVTRRKHAEDLGDFEKVSQLEKSWVLPREKTVGFRLLAEARPVAFVAGSTRVCGGRWNSQNRKNVYLSPYVEEPLNSKVIKRFVPELRSRYVFFEFRDSYVLCIYIWTLYVHFTHGVYYGYVTGVCFFFACVFMFIV